MTVGRYQTRSAYELKPRTGINKYTPEDFTQRGKRTVGTSRMAALHDYLDDYVDDVDEPEPEPEPERVPLPKKVKKISVKRGEEPASVKSTSHRHFFIMLNLEWNLSSSSGSGSLLPFKKASLSP